VIKRTGRGLVVAAAAIVTIAVMLACTHLLLRRPTELRPMSYGPSLIVVAVQPNVPMDFDKDEQELNDLLNRHIAQTEAALKEIKDETTLRLVIWPESPMNFTYAADEQLRARLAEFTRRNRTMLLFNSQEPSPDGSFYNSAILIDEFGRVVARYDKIRLMPFGEYVPLPRWIPGADRVKALVGGFAAGDKYTLMTAGRTRLGTFICIESAYPWVARNLTVAGADVLVNISNDGYLGPTAVMRQHLANAIFRAVENGRPLLRVTNTGITGRISSTGQLFDVTNGFEIATRVWNVDPEGKEQTVYARYGDLFVGICSALSVLMLALSFRVKEVI
jgi:apolipoprotein N-acyltransferase